MKNILLTFIVLILCQNISAQIDPQKTSQLIEENTDYDKIDSIAKVLNLKGGDKIRVYTNFQIDSTGKLKVLKVRAPHKAFEEEAIKLLNMVPTLDPPKSKSGEFIGPVTFSMPIVFVIETEKQKKKRLKREALKTEKEVKKD
ncbi:MULTISPECIES: hypothetical protein [Robertkochia]|uniref:hypothetical protein n=1 Tax=Robertkochia TaxID=1649489 RepID=UPI001931DE73|nr:MULTISPECIES: hypothetical protein [Robertkochia]MBL7471525.1 hypothetical protein [Robertkochia sediminum]